MADTTPAPAAQAGPAETPERDWGRLLDMAGVVAGIVLIVIVADIASDGRLVSRRLHHKPADPDDQPAD